MPTALRALALVVLVLAALPAARPAHAHAALVASEPPDGATVAGAPARLVLRFNEPVAPLVLRLVGPAGEPVDVGTFTVRGHAVEIVPPGELGRGTHLLSWRVVSSDGHPVGGSLAFSIGAPSARSPQAPAAETGGIVAAGLWLTRVVLYAGLLAGVGGAFFRAWIARAGRRSGPAGRAVAAALWAGLAAAVLSVGLQGLDALAAPVTALTRGAVWLAGLRTAYGPTAIVATAALLCGRAALAVSSIRPARVLSLVAVIGAGGALAASGHASTAAPAWLTRPSLFLHVVGLAVWIGALWPLRRALRAEGPAVAAVGRFSAAIPPVLAVVVLAGTALAVVQLGSFAALWSTPYGVILGLKLLAVVGLLGLAAVNRWRLTPALTGREGRGAARWLARSIGAEMVLAAVILGLVAGWRFTPPPRTQPAGRPAPVRVHIHTERAWPR